MIKPIMRIRPVPKKNSLFFLLERADQFTAEVRKCLRESHGMEVENIVPPSALVPVVNALWGTTTLFFP